jgi:methionyl-tRNA formyltransferase
MGQWSRSRGIPSHEYTNTDALADFVESTPADLAVVAGWYHMIPRRIRELFRLGAVGLHASLLPKFRGGAPLNWAILSGSDETGISLFQLTDGVDEGLIFGQRSVEISEATTVTELISRTTNLGVELLRTCLPEIAHGRLRGEQQTGQPSFSLHREREDGRINWHDDADAVHRLIRATTHPYPGAFTTLDGEEIIIWSAEVIRDGPVVHSVPGGIARIPGIDGVVITTGRGLIHPLEASTTQGEDRLELLGRSGYRRLR